jgi:hypothetical protein
LSIFQVSCDIRVIKTGVYFLFPIFGDFVVNPIPKIHPNKTEVRIRAQRTQLWFNPWKGAPCDLVISSFYWSIGVLECWSIGKPETRQTFAGNGNGDPQNFLGVGFKGFRPVLQHSLGISRQSLMSLTWSRGPGFPD